MDNILSKYRDRLVNIRRNNKTINLNKLTKKFFDLSELCEYNFNEKNLINNIISDKESNLFEIQKFKESTEENLKQIDKEETIYKRFQKIKQEINLIRKTSGRHVGYIGYPFLEGKIEREWNGIIEETIIKAPLLLFPVDLKMNRRTQKVILVPQTDMEIQFNKSLAFAIEKYLGKTIDENDQIDILNAMTNKKFNLNRRIEKIINLLSKYMIISDEIPKSTIEKFSDVPYNERIFRIKNYMILGIFIQFSNAIAKDYDKLMELKDLGLVNYVLNDNNAQYGFDAINIDDVSENEKYFVSDIDPSQETSIMSIVKSDNKGIVIHGPPGTGKSQTIVNLISQFVKDKKKVLMVCQKKTALDVVKNRLDAVGIKNAILIEDYVKDRNYALKEMEKIISESSSSCLRKDYKLQEVNNQIDEKLRELNELKEVLGKRYECGLSLFELYSKNNHKYNVIKEPKLRNIFLKYQHDEIKNSLNKLEKLLPYLKYDNNIMKLRKNWKDLSYVDRDMVEKYILELMDLKTNIEKNNISHSISEVYAHIEDIEKSIKLISNIELNFQMSPQKLNILKYTASRLYQLNIPHETYIPLDDLIRYEQKPLKIKKKWEYLSNADKDKIEKIVKELLNCRHKLNEYNTPQYAINDISNDINTLERFVKLLENNGVDYQIEYITLSQIKYTASKIQQLNIPNNFHAPLDDLIRYEQKPLKIKKKWEYLSNADKDKIEKIVKELLNCRHKLNEYGELQHSIKDILNNINTLEEFAKLLETTEIGEKIFETKISELKNQMSKIDKLNIPNDSYIPYDKLRDNEHHLIEYCKFMEKHPISRFLSKLFNSELKKSQLLVEEFEKITNLNYNELYNLHLSLKYLDVFFNDIPNSLTKDTYNEWINKKTKQLSLWELYYNLKSKIPIPELNEEGKKEITQLIRKMIEYGLVHQKYIKYRNSFLEYFNFEDIPNDEELHAILENIEEFEKIRDYEILKNKVKDWDILINSLDEEFFKDIPKEITKNNIENWITKKIEYLQLWELYYDIRQKIPIPELNEKNKEGIILDTKRVINHGLIYREYIKHKNDFLEYFDFRDIPDDKELHTLLEYIEEFEQIRDYEILKNKVKDWNILLNSLDEEFFKDIPKEITKNNIENWITKKIEYLQLWELYYKLKDKFNLPKLSSENKNIVLDELEKLEEHGRIYPKYIEIQQALSKYLKNVEVLSYRELNEILAHLAEFDDIKYYDTLKNDINSNEMELLKYLNKYSKYELMNTYYYTWIDYIENKSHIFKVVKKIDEYNHIKKELEELYEIKVLKTRKHIQKILKSINIGDEAKIKIPHEANKKRRRKPLKEIIDLYENDVFNVAPVWLTTPDVVSAIFPLKKELFDIVIYDEASQMPVEYAIPSLYRAKRFVVAGDEKQLPPTDFFKASFDEDDDEIDGIDELEAKSLLELCKTRCPTVLLSFHYRAKYEEIINFSNYAYYNGKIAISPNKHRGKPFEFIKINGRWENRKNYMEAKKVVEKVHKLLKENSEKSIGIITFNSEHRDLIMDELERRASEDDEFRKLYEKSLNLKKDNEDMSLFVRNIENVQGDERDIIIFSTAYAKDKDGKLRYNFGPLNRIGGENRLNVAITRAKEKVIIITSIEPEDLKVENLKMKVQNY